MTKSNGVPAPPDGLSRRARALWRSVATDYRLENHHYEILRNVCTTVDRLDQVRATIDETGLMVPGSAGQPRPNPLLAEERGLKTTLARLTRELALVDDPPESRPPRIGGGS